MNTPRRRLERIMKQFWMTLIALGLLLPMACSSGPDKNENNDVERAKKMDSADRTRLSVQYMRKGKVLFNDLMTNPDRRAEDFYKVAKVWEKGLKIQPQNTTIRRDLILLYLNMAESYRQRKDQKYAIADKLRKEARKRGEIDPPRARALVEEGKEEGVKAEDAYKRMLTHHEIFFQMTKPTSPREEWTFFRAQVIANLYLNRIQQARNLLLQKRRSLPDDSPYEEQLVRMQRQIDEVIRKAKADDDLIR